VGLSKENSFNPPLFQNSSLGKFADIRYVDENKLFGRVRCLTRQSGQREGGVFGAGAGFGGLFEGGVAAVERVFGLFAVENLLDGEDLDRNLFYFHHD
jgi:hypothetical protein